MDSNTVSLTDLQERGWPSEFVNPATTGLPRCPQCSSSELVKVKIVTVDDPPVSVIMCYNAWAAGGGSCTYIARA